MEIHGKCICLYEVLPQESSVTRSFLYCSKSDIESKCSHVEQAVTRFHSNLLMRNIIKAPKSVAFRDILQALAGGLGRPCLHFSTSHCRSNVSSHKILYRKRYLYPRPNAEQFVQVKIKKSNHTQHASERLFDFSQTENVIYWCVISKGPHLVSIDSTTIIRMWLGVCH